MTLMMYFNGYEFGVICNLISDHTMNFKGEKCVERNPSKETITALVCESDWNRKA